MCVSTQAVRDCSLTGEFDTLSDAQINRFIVRVCPKYQTVISKAIAGWPHMVALHVAHELHEALLMEGQGGAQGAVQSESFQQVGSRSFAVNAQKPDPNAEAMLPGYFNSPYGRRWHGYWVGLPPVFTAIPTS